MGGPGSGGWRPGAGRKPRKVGLVTNFDAVAALVERAAHLVVEAKSTAPAGRGWVLEVQLDPVQLEAVRLDADDQVLGRYRARDVEGLAEPVTTLANNLLGQLAPAVHGSVTELLASKAAHLVLRVNLHGSVDAVLVAAEGGLALQLGTVTIAGTVH